MAFKSPIEIRKGEHPQEARIRRVFLRVTGRYQEPGMEALKPATSMRQAMLAEGYAPSTADNPKQVMESKTWQTLIAENFGEEDTAKLHGNLMRAGTVTTMTFDPDMTDEEIKEIIEAAPGSRFLRAKDVRYSHPKDATQYEADGITPRCYERKAYYVRPELDARDRALDKAYKVRGSYAAEKRVNENINYSLADLRRMKAEGKI
jgi:hypothetical protein